MNGLLCFNGVQKYRAGANPIKWGMMAGGYWFRRRRCCRDAQIGRLYDVVVTSHHHQPKPI